MRDQRATVALRRHLRGGSFDAVFTHQSKAGLLGRVLGRAAGMPRIYHSASMASFGPGYRRAESTAFALAERSTAPLVDRYFVVGSDLALRLRLNGVRAEKLTIVRSSIELGALPCRRRPRGRRRAASLARARPRGRGHLLRRQPRRPQGRAGLRRPRPGGPVPAPRSPRAGDHRRRRAPPGDHRRPAGERPRPRSRRGAAGPHRPGGRGHGGRRRAGPGQQRGGPPPGPGAGGLGRPALRLLRHRRHPGARRARRHRGDGRRR